MDEQERLTMEFMGGTPPTQAGGDSPFSLFAHQHAAVNETRERMKRGARRIVVTIPTGGGKSYVAGQFAWLTSQRGKKWLVLSSRRIVFRGLCDKFRAAGLRVEEINADRHRGPYYANGHVAMLQTLDSRHADNLDGLPEAHTVIVDEAHLQLADAAKRVLGKYVERGSVLIALTATPVGCSRNELPAFGRLHPFYNGLVCSGTSEGLIRQGLLVPGHCYCPDEPNLRGIRKVKGEFPISALDKRFKMSAYEVWGRILTNFELINPEHRPTICFAPGVDPSMYLEAKFNERYGPGFARHIDAETSENERDDIIAAIQEKEPRCRLITNFGVADVGFDCPILSHGIFVRTFGRYSGFSQAAGRLKRAAPGKAYYTLQDHGGSVWRHGHPDLDVTWILSLPGAKGGNDDDLILARQREQRMGERPELQEIICPECRMSRYGGEKCPACGHKHKRSLRVIVETDGTLTKKWGPAFKAGRKGKCADPVKQWWQMVLTGCFCGWTVGCCEVKYKDKTGNWPPQGLVRPADRHLRCEDAYPEKGRMAHAIAAKRGFDIGAGGRRKAKSARW